MQKDRRDIRIWREARYPHAVSGRGVTNWWTVIREEVVLTYNCLHLTCSRIHARGGLLYTAHEGHVPDRPEGRSEMHEVVMRMA